MRSIFQKRSKKRAKKDVLKWAKMGKILENFGKNVLNFKIFWKRADDRVPRNKRP